MSSTDKKIDLATAQKWTKEWRDTESDYNKHHECNAFLIPAQDVEGALAEMTGQTGQKYLRAYLGVDNSTSPSTEKLIIVGTKPQVQRDGTVVYRDIIAGYTPPGDAVNDGSGSIWDFTDPCPPNCDDDSPIGG
ncbi:MAG: hypothetical protein MK211_11660 [Flavobacteriales bacterium]|jgi:hypothetical protein|nr:hypothetical protein [Flavobacteriales bacterium]